MANRIGRFESSFSKYCCKDIISGWLVITKFMSTKLGNLIGGSLDVPGTREDLLTYTSPCDGYSKSSATFLYLVDVLMEFNAEERRKFVGFITGTTCLPAGGLKNLQPRLTIVPAHHSDGPYPSVSTCLIQLNLPEYSSAKDLRHYLLAAMNQTGFHLE